MPLENRTRTESSNPNLTRCQPVARALPRDCHDPQPDPRRGPPSDFGSLLGSTPGPPDRLTLELSTNSHRRPSLELRWPSGPFSGLDTGRNSAIILAEESWTNNSSLLPPIKNDRPHFRKRVALDVAQHNKVGDDSWIFTSGFILQQASVFAPMVAVFHPCPMIPDGLHPLLRGFLADGLTADEIARRGLVRSPSGAALIGQVDQGL